jgi:cytochrome c553
MRDGQTQCISGIFAWQRRQLEQSHHHFLHLCFAGFAVAGDGFFHLQSGVFAHSQIAGDQGGEAGAPGLAQAQSTDALQLRSWASACANCHGTDGRAQPGMPSLVGSSREDMLRTLLEYKNGVLRKGEFVIDIIYRRVRTHDFLVKYDLTVHPLVKAYRNGSVCVVNSFRSDIAQRKAMLDLMTDETLIAKFPLAERKAIRALIPTTRVMGERKAQWGGETVDLPDFVVKNRTKLVLRPNSDGSEMPVFEGTSMDDVQWDRAVKRAIRERYVVQEVVAPVTAKFPISVYGMMDMKEMLVSILPYILDLAMK